MNVKNSTFYTLYREIYKKTQFDGFLSLWQWLSLHNCLIQWTFWGMF